MMTSCAVLTLVQPSQIQLLIANQLFIFPEMWSLVSGEVMQGNLQIHKNLQFIFSTLVTVIVFGQTFTALLILESKNTSTNASDWFVFLSFQLFSRKRYEFRIVIKCNLAQFARRLSLAWMDGRIWTEINVLTSNLIWLGTDYKGW